MTNENVMLTAGSISPVPLNFNARITCASEMLSVVSMTFSLVISH